jgi:hypothetical protein
MLFSSLVKQRNSLNVIQNSTDRFDLTLVPKPSIEHADLDNVSQEIAPRIIDHHGLTKLNPAVYFVRASESKSLTARGHAATGSNSDDQRPKNGDA